MDEEGQKVWTLENIKKAENELLHTPCALFDDLAKNYENNPELQKMIDSILVEGAEYAFVMTDPVISQGVMLGIFKRRGNIVTISNVIFETLLYNHVMSKKSREKQIFTGERSQFLENGELNMPQILSKFQEIMKTEYRKEDEKRYF